MRASHKEDSISARGTAQYPVATTLQDLFSTLSTWEPNGDLVLDISASSPRDPYRCFKHVNFMPDIPSGKLSRRGIEQSMIDQSNKNAKHGWGSSRQDSASSDTKPLNTEELERQWWAQLPLVPAVTSVRVCQQDHPKWKPVSLAHMFARFPRLQEVHYEPWRELHTMQRYTDKCKYLSQTCRNLSRPLIFILALSLTTLVPRLRLPTALQVPCHEQQAQETRHLRERPAVPLYNAA